MPTVNIIVFFNALICRKRSNFTGRFYYDII